MKPMQKLTLIPIITMLAALLMMSIAAPAYAATEADTNTDTAAFSEAAQSDDSTIVLAADEAPEESEPLEEPEEPEEPEPAVQPHWIYQNRNWYYILANGEKAKYWLNVDGEQYYLNSKGEMKTGWLYCKGSWYYFNRSGAMVRGWRYINGNWYFFNSNGTMKQYWLKDGGKWYYLNSSGAMVTGWLYCSKDYYYFYSNGSMASNCWINYRYYVNGNGEWVYRQRTLDLMMHTDRAHVVAWLSSHENDSYYIGTPYAGRNASSGPSKIYGWNPTGCIRPYGRYAGYNPGMNCTGFVADVLAYSGAGWDIIEQQVGKNGRNYIGATAWFNYAMQNNALYYHFDTISEALNSGKLKKGDIIYFKPYTFGRDRYGNGGDTHMGIFWGNTSGDNRFWHSTAGSARGVEGAGTLSRGNQISVLSPPCVSEVYVFPLS